MVNKVLCVTKRFLFDVHFGHLLATFKLLTNLCAQVDSASSPSQREINSSLRRRPCMAHWGDGMSPFWITGPVVG